MNIFVKFAVAIPVALASTVVCSCDATAPGNSTQSSQAASIEPPKTPIMIRTMAGTKKEKAFLVQPTLDVPLDQLAAGIRETGYSCKEVTAFNQLEDSGRAMDIYKVDCGKRSYQVTVIDHGTHVKPWTGNIFGK